ncbi:SAVED domain-containing protein [Thiohalocapsa sp. ML1]|jgi:hypothetical protein|uniref:SAVED domain-containing protein n=1 Tax=Thiohalocapsa sp. ML1 TaxID=1431688 RepID=UPI0007323DF1|nr:SAVED domain-containing protein [Thiohalocapsa sp. ML1]
MWKTTSDFIATYLDPVGIVLGLVIAVPVFWTWWEVSFGRRRRERRWFREFAKRPGACPGILIVDLRSGLDVKSSVERFRRGRDELRDIPADRVFSITRDKHLGPDDMPDLHRELRDTARQIAAGGTDTLHYFHAGPACLAAVVGAEFANTCRVILWQYGAGEYTSFGPLRLIS